MRVGYLDGLVLFEKESGATASGKGLWGRHVLRIIDWRVERERERDDFICEEIVVDMLIP